jgi:hypothetical protein
MVGHFPLDFLLGEREGKKVFGRNARVSPATGAKPNLPLLGVGFSRVHSGKVKSKRPKKTPKYLKLYDKCNFADTS